MKAFLINNKLKGKALVDSDFGLVRLLKADKTPEVFLLDKNAKTIYYGAIDNFAFDVGRTRTITTRFYLKNALDQLLIGERISVPFVEAIGCFIE